MNRIRSWLGRFLMAASLRLLLPEDEVEELLSGRQDDDLDGFDDGEQPFPPVALSDKAREMLAAGNARPPTAEPEPSKEPVPGSIAARIAAARR